MENKIIKSQKVNWKELKLFQPAEMKRMSKAQLKKLKLSLSRNGFRSPFYVWEDENGELYCLDGHHRIPTLFLLEKDGEPIPEKLPANFVRCKDIQEAKKTVLIFNSHYAKIQKESLLDWVEDLDFDEMMEEIDLPNINFDLSPTKEETIQPNFQIIIDFQNQQDLEQAYGKLIEEKYQCRIIV